MEIGASFLHLLHLSVVNYSSYISQRAPNMFSMMLSQTNPKICELYKKRPCDEIIKTIPPLERDPRFTAQLLLTTTPLLYL
jgi:hypothetical protein